MALLSEKSRTAFFAAIAAASVLHIVGKAGYLSSRGPHVLKKEDLRSGDTYPDTTSTSNGLKKKTPSFLDKSLDTIHAKEGEFKGYPDKGQEDTGLHHLKDLLMSHHGASYPLDSYKDEGKDFAYSYSEILEGEKKDIGLERTGKTTARSKTSSSTNNSWKSWLDEMVSNLAFTSIILLLRASYLNM